MDLNSSGKITVNAEWLRIVSTGERAETGRPVSANAVN